MIFRSLPALLLFCWYIPGAVGASWSLQREDQELLIEIDSRVDEGRHEAIRHWIETTSHALTLVYGRWPRDRWRIEVAPLGRSSRSPVPWGQVRRGDIDTVSFYISSDATRADLVGDWTAYHELSHLLLPYRGWGDKWFSEGLATYYQNLLQLRSGQFSEQKFWQKLYEGFKRGSDNRSPELSLRELSPRMGETRSYMRVYWSGAWYFLKADLELRKRSNGTQSLDSALEQLNRCCGDGHWTARAIAVKLDQLTGEDVFLPLFEEVGQSHAIPDWRGLLGELAVDVDGAGVVLQPEGAGAVLRRKIAATQATREAPSLVRP